MRRWADAIELALALVMLAAGAAGFVCLTVLTFFHGACR